MALQEHKFLPPFAALKAFDAVGRAGSIRKAAKDMGVDHAVISRHLNTLEQWTGVRLLERTGDGSRLTDPGRDYHVAIVSAFSAIAHATQDMSADNSRPLKVWSYPEFADRWLMPRLFEYMRDNSSQQIDLTATYDEPDLAGRAVDMHLRFVFDTDDIPEYAQCTPLLETAVLPVASASYLAKVGPIMSDEQLLSLDLLHPSEINYWPIWFRYRGIGCPAKLPGPRFGQSKLSVRAAMEGLGVALVSSFLSHEEIESGRLLVIRPRNAMQKPPVTGKFVLVGRADRWSTPSMARFRQWLLRSDDVQRPKLVAAG